MKRSTFAAMASVAVLAVSSQALAQFTLSPLATFGDGDGWRAPGEALPGDAPGTTDIFGAYHYLSSTTAALERGLAYNPVSGNLILVSRSPEANWVRVLDGQTGVDKGFLNLGPTGFITGGFFVRNMVGVTSDGAIYMGNLTLNASTAPLKVYRWENEQAEPTVFFGNTLGVTWRLGDSMDVTGSGSDVRVVFGASGAVGYAVVTSAGAQLVSSFTPVNVPVGGLRLGITFTDNPNEVWGKQTGAAMYRTTYTDGNSQGVRDGVTDLTVAGETMMDYAVIAGTPYLVTADINSSLVRVYDVTNPASAQLVVSATAVTSPPPTSNGNGVGSIKFGPINHQTGTALIYVLNTNAGIQALTLTVPTPGPNFILGDFNFDGGLDGSDVDPFVLALSDLDTYLADFADAFAAAYPSRTLDASVVDIIGDFNGDSGFDGSDVDGFVAALSAGRPGIAAIPEPAALGLLAPVAALAMRRRRA